MPAIIGYNIESVKKRIEDIMSLGYNKNEVIKMIKTFPTIYGLNIDNLKKKIEDMVLLGYTKEEVIKISILCPAIYIMNFETIKNKLNVILDFDYSLKETLQIIKEFPYILASKEENIRQKLQFYKFIGLDKIVINKPKQLIQSVELSYARYMFYLSKGVVITESNCKKLFMDQKQFKKIYKLDNNQLIKMFDYEQFIKNTEFKKNI